MTHRTAGKQRMSEGVKTGKKPRGEGRRFQPGNNANPHGRPPVALCLTDTLRADALALAEMRIGKKTIKGENVALGWSPARVPGA